MASQENSSEIIKTISVPFIKVDDLIDKITALAESYAVGIYSSCDLVLSEAQSASSSITVRSFDRAFETDLITIKPETTNEDPKAELFVFLAAFAVGFAQANKKSLFDVSANDLNELSLVDSQQQLNIVNSYKVFKTLFNKDPNCIDVHNIENIILSYCSRIVEKHPKQQQQQQIRHFLDLFMFYVHQNISTLCSQGYRYDISYLQFYCQSIRCHFTTKRYGPNDIIIEDNQIYHVLILGENCLLKYVWRW